MASCARPGRRRRAARVAVLGGGVASLTVTTRKAGSTSRLTSAARRARRRNRRSLPSSDGPFWPGLHQNLSDTMRRIPFQGTRDGVYGNLTAASQDAFARGDGRPTVTIALRTARPPPVPARAGPGVRRRPPWSVAWRRTKPRGLRAAPDGAVHQLRRAPVHRMGALQLECLHPAESHSADYRLMLAESFPAS